MGLFRRRRRTAAPAELPAPLPTNTLQGAAQLGGMSGSGAVEPWHALQLSYANQQSIREDVGHHQLVADVPQLPDLPAASLYADRPLFGGVRTAPQLDSYRDEVMIGGHTVMANRPPLVMVEADTMAPQTWATPTEWRDAPPVVDLCRRGGENLPTAAGFAGKASI